MNKAEQSVRNKLENNGYLVFKNGWPDFFAIRGRDYLVIEVKGSKHKGRTYEQRIAHAFLKSLGIRVDVLRSHDGLPEHRLLQADLAPIPTRGKNGRPRTYHLDRPSTQAERNKHRKNRQR